MHSKTKILLIDDDVELTQLIKDYLISADFEVLVLHHGEQVKASLVDYQPDIILLDLMLPNIDGLTICKSIRSDFDGAIIMLTALGDDIDEVTGLEVGADDYLAKPVKPRVLLAHIRAQIRRQHKLNQLQAQTSVWCSKQSISVDPSSRTVSIQGTEVMMTSAEFDLLWLLAQNVGQAVKREFLHEQIFRLPYDSSDRSVDLRISRIRKKMGDDPKEPWIIKTVRNYGYLLAQ